MRELIFDLGANAGQNLEYFLSKSRRVVAVEANSALCRDISRRFSEHIRVGALVVINAAIVPEGSNETAWFLEHSNSVQSTVSTSKSRPTKTPGIRRISRIQTISVDDLIQEFGRADYVKIDIEGMDGDIVRALLRNVEFAPPTLSFEAHDIETLAAAVGARMYRSFKLVPQWGVRRHLGARLKDLPFPTGSSGPFGEDIPGEWHSAECVTRDFLLRRGSWLDVHASVNLPETSCANKPQFINSIVFRELRARPFLGITLGTKFALQKMMSKGKLLLGRTSRRLLTRSVGATRAHYFSSPKDFGRVKSGQN